MPREVIRRIADKFMTQVRAQLSEQNQTIVIEDSALDYLAEHGYSETMGARPMKRLINEQVRLPIAKRIIKEGLTVHHISGGKGELVIT